MPVRVVITNTVQATEVMADCYVEETQDSSAEFAYADFLSMLHKRVRSKAQNKN